MSDHDSFEERLREMADQISRSMQRVSELDLEQLAERYGVDAQRARAAADFAGRWLSDQLAGGDFPFGGSQPRHDSGADSTSDADRQPGQESADAAAPSGPHPLDLPTNRQGQALAGLDSGRTVVRPGSNQLTDTGEGPPQPAAPDLVGELRARDWITADGALTVAGRHALGRWCGAAADPGPPPPDPV